MSVDQTSNEFASILVYCYKLEDVFIYSDDIGLAYRIPVSKTIFTATASQIVASRVGFEVLAERKYTELLDDEGKVAFPGVNVDLMKVMGKRLF